MHSYLPSNFTGSKSAAARVFPNYAHLIGVSSLVMECGGDEDEAIAGLLHDAAEDQGGLETLAKIALRFGPAVSAIVEGCTDSVESPKPPWRARKEKYLRHLKEAPPSVQFVSACDKLFNARAIVRDYREAGEALWARFSGGREGVLWYYGALAETFTISRSVVDELRRVVQELDRLVAR